MSIYVDYLRPLALKNHGSSTAYRFVPEVHRAEANLEAAGRGGRLPSSTATDMSPDPSF